MLKDPALAAVLASIMTVTLALILNDSDFSDSIHDSGIDHRFGFSCSLVLVLVLILVFAGFDFGSNSGFYFDLNSRPGSDFVSSSACDCSL